MNFNAWMLKVNHELERISGLGATDIPDWDYRDAFNGGLDPREAAKEALQEADFPFGDDA